MEPQVSHAEAVGRVHLPDVRTEPQGFDGAKLLCKIVGEDEKPTSKSKVDLACLSPCHSAFKPHIQRVNHWVALYKRVDESILEKRKPYDDGQGWIKNEDGVLELVWSHSLVDILDTGDREEEEEEEEENEEERVWFWRFQWNRWWMMIKHLSYEAHERLRRSR